MDEIKMAWIRDGGWPEAGSASFGRLRARWAKEEMAGGGNGVMGKEWRTGVGVRRLGGS